MEMIENAMVVDNWWDEQEYGVPSKRQLKRMREAYKDAEMEDREDEYII